MRFPRFRRTAEHAHTWGRKGLLVSSLITALTAVIAVIAWPGGPSAWSLADRYEFRTSLSAFVKIADSPSRDGRLDWTTDKCSAPVLGSAGKTYDFTDSCRRHDFAYRNLARLDGGRKWTAELRKRVDDRFLADMRNHCAHRRTIERAACRGWADLYYNAVRQFAGP